MPKLICSECESQLSVDDFNVSTDLAHCRQCGTTQKYSDLVDLHALDEVSLSNPPQWIRVIDSPKGEVLQYRRVHPAVFLVILFELFWTGGTLFAHFPADSSTGLFMALLSVFPFLLFSSLLLVVVLYMLLGKEIIQVGTEETICKHGACWVYKTRRFNNEDFRSVRLVKADSPVDDHHDLEISIVLEDKTEIRFGSLVQEACQKYMVVYLKSKLFSMTISC